MTNPLGNLAALAIGAIWQQWIGHRYNRRRSILCRFHPTCSAYAALAFRQYGLLRGLRLVINRLRRCNPDNTDSCIDFP
jgi:putative component of membrane protein insertase Oxa1/YidC/SpoIIIJ protein YidD